VKNIKIPFDKNGNMKDYVGYSYEDMQSENFINEYVRENTIWRDNYEFEAELKFTSYGRGRSSATFELQDNNGIKYNVFMSDMFKIVTTKTITDGKVNGKWFFRKQGQNYGLCVSYGDINEC
jgi:hypothetical protein